MFFKGYNKGFKTNGIKTNLSKKQNKRINQNFIQIPLSKFKERIKYLYMINNIKYTEIKYHNDYKGKRITRSLFKTSSEKIINALNILAKSKPEKHDILLSLRNIGQTVPIRQKIKLN